MTQTDGFALHGGPVLLLGTRKGAWVLAADEARRSWSVSGPMFLGHIIQHAVFDRRNRCRHDHAGAVRRLSTLAGGHIIQHAVLDPRDRRTVLLATRTGHLGPTIFRSTNLGRDWTEARQPPAFTTGDALDRSLRAVLWLTPGPPHEVGVWYAGGSPQGLFRSDDGGDTWESVAGWNDHPMWETWCEWPEENTPDGSMLHSVIVDPRDSDHLYLGLSAGGVFETVDGGRDWKPLNAGSVAPMAPDVETEFGQDPHCVRLHPLAPDRLYQQNHCGIYRMDRPDGRWVRIGENMPSDVGDIGFPIELHPRDPDTAWVFPMDGTDVWPRTSPEGKPAVYVTHDAGESWERRDGGLPERAWFTVKRQAMTVDTADSIGVYFGTTSGEVWASADEGSTWTQVAAHLPEIYSVEYADPIERE
jgi:photosystem II stability/assembly factor-like uncharacterized protein